MTQDNVTQVISLLIQKLDVSVTRQSIVDEIARHPNNRTLLVISEVLNNWKIPNAAYQLSFPELIEAEVTAPFLAHLNTHGGEFVVVDTMDDKIVSVSNQRWNKHKLNVDEFKAQYSGLMLIAEKEETSGEADFTKKRRKEVIENIRTPFVIVSAVTLLVAFLAINSSYADTISWYIALLSIFKSAGLVTAVLLLVQSIDTNNPMIKKLCGGDSKKNCNAILSSKAAKVTDELSWSEVGFFYFAGTWLILLFNTQHTALIQMLAFLNIISLPYTVYSIYHQWRVAKQWCVFCCAVQALLWLEFFAFLPALKTPTQWPALAELISLITGLALPILTWVFIKPYFLSAKQIVPLKKQLRNFKYNAELFQKLLNAEVKYALPAEEHSIILGNPEAEYIITMVSNPFCQPCAYTHKTLDEWLSGRDNIKLQVVFAINDDDKPKLAVASHLLSLKSSQNDISLRKAFDDWYDRKQKTFETWADEHPVAEIIDTTEALEKQKAWCSLADIMYTPTIFINGRKLPQNYQPEDLKYFI